MGNLKRTVVVAMSGGVDSSVAAALLVEQGYRVIGLMLRLWAEDSSAANRCCTPDAISDARQVAGQLGIPFYARDYRQTFKQTIVDYFITTYAQGLTPNPCLICNQRIRFGQMLDEALTLGAGWLATGHYVRRRQTAQGDFQLLKGVDPAKDQSYVLQRLTQTQLSHALFPLGDYVKTEVREMAKLRDLPVFNRPDSQDLCFVGDGGYRAFLSRHVPALARPGPLMDTSGQVLGQHQGLAHYTVGQRKGLGIATGKPLYVLHLDPVQNAVIVGASEDLGSRELVAGQITTISGQPLTSSPSITAKIRYKAAELPATLTPLNDDRVHVRFSHPLRDITPGQGIAFYQGQMLLGGGTIDRPKPEPFHE